MVNPVKSPMPSNGLRKKYSKNVLSQVNLQSTFLYNPPSFSLKNLHNSKKSSTFAANLNSQTLKNAKL